jgi:hypothetical protein
MLPRTDAQFTPLQMRMALDLADADAWGLLSLDGPAFRIVRSLHQF